MYFCREEWTTHFWEKCAMENCFQANPQKLMQTLQICCKTVNINVAWSKNNIIIHSLLTLQLFESAIMPDFVAVYTACQLPIGKIAVLG